MNAIYKMDDEYKFLTEELLRNEYLTNKLSDRQIAQKYGVGSKVSVWRRRKFYNIENINPKKSNKNACVNRKFSFQLEDAIKWKSSGKTYIEIAKEIGCSRMVVCRRFKELGIVNTTPEAMKKLRWSDTLTDVQFRFILGTLLGDGNITPGGMFQCNHSHKQLDYIKWKMEILKSLLSPLFILKPHMANDGTGKKHEAYYLRTMQNKYLKNVYSHFYPEKIKIFPDRFLRKSSFDAFSLAIWFMDDGTREHLFLKKPSIFTYGFKNTGTELARFFLLDRFGIRVSNERDKGRDTEQDCFLSINDDSKFFSLIAPYVHPSMAYKLPESFRQQAGMLLPQNNPV